MASNENRCWETGELVQIKKNVQGAGEIGLVIGLSAGIVWSSSGCFDVLFGESIKRCHSGNLQAPDPRLYLPPR
jgi:hypothetical protein